MKLALTALAILIGLLSVAAGGVKIALIPAETAFHAQFGFSDLATRLFGAVQLFGGALLMLPATRLHGSVIVAAGFAVSTALIFSSGNTAFGGVSLVPVALALLIFHKSRAGRPSKHSARNSV